MHITTPQEITDIAWEGELAEPAGIRSAATAARPVVTIGRPEVWPAAEVLGADPAHPWVPPLGGAQFWLVRLACTLREPKGLASISEAEEVLQLRPRDAMAPPRAAYALSLLPDRLSVEDGVEMSAKLGPELEFATAKVKAGELAAKVDFRRVFPVIQGYGAGEPNPYWVFRPHPRHPLAGTQCVYAVVAALAGAGGIRAQVSLTVTVEARLGPLKLGMPEEAKARTALIIP